MKPWKRTAALMIAVTPLACGGLGIDTARAVTSDCSEFTVGIERLVNTKTDASLLTQYSSEITSAANYGFATSDGVAFKAAPSSGSDLVEVWRAYNSKTHDFAWAAEGSDLTALEKDGYVAQFRQFYASTVNNDCVSTAYRLSNGNKTRVVVGATERDALVAKGWTVAKSGMFYAVPGTRASNNPPTPTPTPTPEVGDDFTVAVYSDTQQETWTDSDTRLRNRSQWLVDNASSLNLKFATHIGDVVDWGNVAPVQYTRAQNGMAPLNGRIPYSLSLGNHDTAAVCAGGSACEGADASVTVRDTTAFNKAFPASTYSNLKGQFEAGKVDNSFSTFSAGGQKWMVLNLELWPRQAAIDWAKRVVGSHADHNVIVATHSYLNSDGSISTSNGGYGATSPKHLFDTLIKVYPNIKVVVSGHVGGGARRVDTGDNGNKIVSLLQCYHSRTTNPVRLLKISVAKGTVTDWVYGPYTNETLSAQTTTSGFDFTR